MLNLPQNPKWDIARVSHSTLVNADCFDVFPFIEDKIIEAIIVENYGADVDCPFGDYHSPGWQVILTMGYTENGLRIQIILDFDSEETCICACKDFGLKLIF